MSASAPSSNPSTPADTVPRWRLRGHVIVACNCDYGCPCNFNGRPSRGNCEGNWNWHIEEGEFGDVSLSGLTFSLAVNWPGAIHEGNGDGLLVLDQQADEPQRNVILRLISGQAGGPWKIIRATIARLNGPEYAPYAVSLDGYSSSVKAGRYITVEMEPVRNPVTKAEVHPRAILPEGFVFKEGRLGASAKFRIEGPVSFDHSGRYAALAPFEYQGP